MAEKDPDGGQSRWQVMISLAQVEPAIFDRRRTRKASKGQRPLGATAGSRWRRWPIRRRQRRRRSVAASSQLLARIHLPPAACPVRAPDTTRTNSAYPDEPLRFFVEAERSTVAWLCALRLIPPNAADDLAVVRSDVVSQRPPAILIDVSFSALAPHDSTLSP